MKTRISTAMLWIVALLFVAQEAQAQTAFEGRVIQSISAAQLGDEKMEMTMNIKGEKMMINMDMGAMGAMKMFTSNGGKTMTMIMEQMKQGFEMQIPDDVAKPASTSAEPAMKATGKKETINGYAAEEWIANLDENNSMTFWLTSDIDKSLVKAMQTAMKAQNAQSPNSSQAEIMKVMTDKGMIAVRTIVTNGGETAAVVDLVKIEKASIPDATFTIPADIKVQKMDPSMMNGSSPTN
jgi:hypothetical protein